MISGSRKETVPQDGAEFGFVYKAHPAAHIEIRLGGCNTVDGPKGKQDVDLFFSGSLSAGNYQNPPCLTVKENDLRQIRLNHLKISPGIATAPRL
jgi:hypothetical protein